MSKVSTDPISDMLTRIRNAISVHKNEVFVPYSKIKHSIADVLVKNGFIESVEHIEDGIDSMIKITITADGHNAKITEISRMSKPGRRLYASADKLPKVKQGRGLVIVSTPKGLMTDQDARKKRLGGELICKVY